MLKMQFSVNVGKILTMNHSLFLPFLYLTVILVILEFIFREIYQTEQNLFYLFHP